MKRITFIIAFLLLFCTFGANAYSGRLKTNNISIKNGRLFEVDVAFGGKGVLAAGTFTLSYDSGSVDYREVTACVEDSSVKVKNEKGKTTVIFLCGNGVKTDNSPVLFKVKYKTVSENSSEIEIKARDCVDGNAEQFKSPSRTVCKINVIPTEESRTGSSSRRTSKVSGGKSSADSPVLTEKAAEKETEDEEIEFRVKRNNDNSSEITLIVLVITAVVFVLLCLYYENNKSKSRKKPDDDSENK